MTSGKLKTLPAAKKKDAALEAEMIRAIKARGWQNETPIKVIILETRMLHDSTQGVAP